ncbi:tRNA pseudouridine(13) synthase TruD [Pseudoalteromonas luteoviolacea]|uniref:tRNA pseudouridine(13) synthase TruD n=1 Tax=Pseudoalteromonas luteoviolacea TaxID=43657 RepID=UPI0007B0B1FD|nr:tRNA pseudouridine(13) synthase TruD [Pseudoalteromonas luteoviolacea]TQF73010.1 tRNA pseudouridine(13) synthase TruD [Pseudoalteromonas luteoviolacea]
MSSLNYLYGKPLSDGDFKRSPEDFVVDEVLDIDFTGEGEHVCLQIIKRGENTAFVAKKIAQLAGVSPRDVSYAGLKDRHGVCTQWFSVPVPIKTQVEFSKLNSDSIVVIKQIRHNRKLRTGCHRGNRFIITLRNVTEPLDVLSRINAVRQGVPNYFAEQRFGHDGHNLVMAQRMFDGEFIRDKKLRGIIISAARSHLFNQIVSRRVKEHGLAKTWHREVFLLAGSNAFFEDDLNDDIVERLNREDILLSAPLVGKGEKGLTNVEREWLREFDSWHQGLAGLGLKNERRSLRVIPKELKLESMQDNVIKLTFELPKGCYATSVLRELINHKDVSLADKHNTGDVDE